MRVLDFYRRAVSQSPLLKSIELFTESKIKFTQRQDAASVYPVMRKKRRES